MCSHAFSLHLLPPGLTHLLLCGADLAVLNQVHLPRLCGLFLGLVGAQRSRLLSLPLFEEFRRGTLVKAFVGGLHQKVAGLGLQSLGGLEFARNTGAQPGVLGLQEFVALKGLLNVGLDLSVQPRVDILVERIGVDAFG